MYKIFRLGNYVVLNDTIKGEVFYGYVKDVFIDKNNLNRDVFSFFNIKDWDSKLSIPLSKLTDKDGLPYTSQEFEDFYTQNTGNFKSGVELTPQISDALLAADNPSISNPFATESLERVKSIQNLQINTQGQVVVTYTDQDGISQTLTTTQSTFDIKYNVENYTELLTIVGQDVLDLVYVRKAQGTQWLPGGLGGDLLHKRFVHVEWCKLGSFR